MTMNAEKCQRQRNVRTFSTLTVITMLLISNIDYEYLCLLNAIHAAYSLTRYYIDLHGIHTGGRESLQRGGLLYECEYNYLILAKSC